jgi:hypothetical protein
LQTFGGMQIGSEQRDHQQFAAHERSSMKIETPVGGREIRNPIVARVTARVWPETTACIPWPTSRGSDFIDKS